MESLTAFGSMGKSFPLLSSACPNLRARSSGQRDVAANPLPPRPLNRPNHRPRLIHRLLKLLLRHRVRHNPRPPLKVPLPPIHIQRPKRNTRNQIPAEVRNQHAPPINPTPSRLQLLNNLHRPNLRSPTQRSRRKTSPKRINRIQPRAQLALKRTHHMHYMAIPLHHHQLLHLHRPKLTHPPHVIPPQVHQHDVFGNFFLIPAHIGLKCPIFRLIGTPRPRPRNRPILHIPPMYPHQQLRRRPDDMRRRRSQRRRTGCPTSGFCGRGFSPSQILQPKPQKIHIRRRINNPQRPINLKRIHSRHTIEPLRQHTLKNISRSNVLLRPLHRFQKSRLRSPRRNLQLPMRLLLPSHRQSPCQLLFQTLEPPPRPLISSLPPPPPQIRRHNQMNLFLHMIERKHLIKKHQAGIRYAQLILSHRRQPLNLPHHVIRKETHSSSGKRRQPRQSRRSMPTERLLQLLKNISLKLALAPPLTNRNPSPTRRHLLVRLNPDERIPPHMLAALDRLQQKSLRLFRSNSQKSRDRCLQICCHCPINGHQRMLTAQLQKIAL